MIVIAINKKKSLDMFKSRKKIENINDFLKLQEISFKAEKSKRTDWHTHTHTDSQQARLLFII